VGNLSALLELYRGLAELYVSDSRFTEIIDRVRPGLAGFMRDAFRANTGRASRTSHS